MQPNSATLFIFAHQDDEVFILPRIKHEQRTKEVFCAFLTGGQDVGSRRRRKESLTVLSRYGISAEHIVLLGDILTIPDAKLINHLSTAFEGLSSLSFLNRVSRIIVPAWEGGHHDHDACAILAWALKSKLANPSTEVLQYSLYHGEGLPWRLFHVMKPLANSTPSQRVRTFRFSEGLSAFLAIRFFASQLSTWIGLAPGAFLGLVLRRKEVLVPLTREQLDSKPHQGSLLYERYQRTTFPKVRERGITFLEQLEQKV